MSSLPYTSMMLSVLGRPGVLPSTGRDPSWSKRVTCWDGLTAGQSQRRKVGAWGPSLGPCSPPKDGDNSQLRLGSHLHLRGPPRRSVVHCPCPPTDLPPHMRGQGLTGPYLWDWIIGEQPPRWAERATGLSTAPSTGSKEPRNLELVCFA